MSKPDNKIIFTLSGIVRHGNKIGRKLGYPTLNLEVPKDFPLDLGIYAGFMEYKKIKYPGVISVGITPNFAVTKPKLEIHIFDFNQDLYEQMIKVTFTHYLRKEKKFPSTEELIKQIERDCLKARMMYLN